MKSAPSEPVAVPLHSRIKALDGLKDIRLVKTVADMRKEGRSQSHCIGSEHYIRSLFKGYQALNYKGYTFYLDPNLNIVETKGSHNRATPYEIQNELLNLIKQSEV